MAASPPAPRPAADPGWPQRRAARAAARPGAAGQPARALGESAISICRGPRRAASPAASSRCSRPRRRSTGPRPRDVARRPTSCRFRRPRAWRAPSASPARSPPACSATSAPPADGSRWCAPWPSSGAASSAACWRRDPPHRGRRGDRSRPRCARGPLPDRAALARPGLEPAERVRPRRAVQVPEHARYRAGPDRCRPGAGPGLQPARHPDRPLAPQRAGLLGRRAAVAGAAGRDPLQRPRAVPERAQPDRRPAARDPRVRRHGRRQLRGQHAAGGRRAGRRDAARGDGPALRPPDRAAGRGQGRASARTSTAPSCPSAIKDAAGLPRLVAALRAAGYDAPLLRRSSRFENWLRVLERTWAA